MALQFTPAQEERILAAVRNGVYPSVDEALEAAVSAIEMPPDFEGTAEELDRLLLEGWNANEIEADEAFWEGLKDETDKITADHQASKLDS